MKSFEDARLYTRKLGIKSRSQWEKRYWKTHEKPADIPLHPERRYKNEGWKGFEDFLGIPLFNLK